MRGCGRVSERGRGGREQGREEGRAKCNNSRRVDSKVGSRSQSEVLTVWCYIQTKTHTDTEKGTYIHIYNHTNTHSLFPSDSHPHILDCKNFWTAQMYCIQMHFQRVALKLAALSPRLTLTHSLSLLLKVLGQNSQVLLFNSNFFYISHTQKGSHKKVNVQKFSTKPKVMLGIIRNWIRLRYRGWFPPPPSISLFLLLLACKCSFHFPSVTHTACQQYRSILLPSSLWSCNCRQANCQSDCNCSWSRQLWLWLDSVCVSKEVEGVCRTPWQQFESQIEVEVEVRRNKAFYGWKKWEC